VGQTFYRGPQGACACCQKPTPVKVASFDGTVPMGEWEIKKDLLHRLYRDVVRSQRRDQTLCPECQTRASNFIWISLGALGEDDGVVGPFCTNCAYTKKREFESMDGQNSGITAYHISINKNAREFATRVMSKQPKEPVPSSSPSVKGIVF
jgi:hypothetical protein